MPNVRTDLAGLRQYLNLPAGDYKCKWILRNLGAANSRVPGPTDYAITAFIEIDEGAWAQLPALRLPPVEPMEDLPGSRADSLLVKPELAQKLLPESALSEAQPAPGGFLVLQGQAIAKDSLAKHALRIGRAVRLGDGLFVTLQTS